MKLILQLSGWMEKARPSKSATSIQTANSVAGIAEYWGPIIDSTHTRPSVPSVAMCMGQMDLTCTKGCDPNVSMGLRGSGTGGP